MSFDLVEMHCVSFNFLDVVYTDFKQFGVYLPFYPLWVENAVSYLP